MAQTGKSKHLRLTQPATGCHVDVQVRAWENIYLAVSDLTGEAISSFKAQVAQHAAFPVPLAEEMVCVCVCVYITGSLALSACLQTMHAAIFYILILGSLYK